MDTRKIQPVPNGLIGLHLHTFDAKGLLEKQGRIIGIDGDMVLVQLYSWLDGGETCVEGILRANIYSECKLFATCALMRDAAYRWEAQNYKQVA